MKQIKAIPVGTLWYPDPAFNHKVQSIITTHRTHMKVHRIIVKNKYRGTGIGTIFMIALTHHADKNHKMIFLSPSIAYGGSSIPRLVKFYKRFGFIENKGRYYDCTTNDTMYRLPHVEK